MQLDVPPDQLPEPPQWLIEQLDQLTQPAAATNITIPKAEIIVVSIQENKIPKGMRNKTLTRLAGSMRRVGMSLAEISVAIHQANKDRCEPPLPQQEVDRIAKSVASYEPDQIATAMVEGLWEQICEAIAAGEIVEEEVEIPNMPDPGPIPDELLRVPGFIDDVMQYTLATAPYPEPVLAFAGALTLQALLAGRKVRDEMDNRTNLYVLSLANSGVGKDHARKVNAKILYEVGLAECLGTSFASGEGIEDRLFVQPATLFQVDEIDGLLLRVSQSKEARHEQIISILLQMYSSASSIYVMRAKAGCERTAIDQPCLCLFGTAVPKNFYQSLSERLMVNGFLARLIILECRSRGIGRDSIEMSMPASIIETARWWAEFKPGNAGNLTNWHPQPYNIAQSPDAKKMFRSIRERADAEYIKCEQANDPAGMAIWARVYEKARRLALIYACSANHKQPIITAEAVTWAGAFVEHQTRRMLNMVGRYVCENEFDARRKRLLEILDLWRQQHGEDWMPFWRISRALPWSRREHEEIRNTLIEQRLIESQIQVSGKRGRPGLCYRLIGPQRSQGI
jgi:hypothetical protein